MSDLIDRKTVFDVIDKCILEKLEGDTVEIKELLKLITKIYRIPSAQPERKKGKWITVLGRLGNEVECNQCHSVFWYWMGNYRFCPSCGARMDGESDE